VGGGVVGLGIVCVVAGGFGVGGGLVDAFLCTGGRWSVGDAASGSAVLGLGLRSGGEGLLCELPHDQLGAEGCGGYVGSEVDSAFSATVSSTAVISVPVTFTVSVTSRGVSAAIGITASDAVGVAVAVALTIRTLAIVPAISFGFLFDEVVRYDLGFGLAFAGARIAALTVTAVVVVVVAAGVVSSGVGVGQRIVVGIGVEVAGGAGGGRIGGGVLAGEVGGGGVVPAAGGVDLTGRRVGPATLVAKAVTGPTGSQGLAPGVVAGGAGQAGAGGGERPDEVVVLVVQRQGCATGAVDLGYSAGNVS